MANYPQVKSKLIEIVGWFTRDKQFAARYGTNYTAATRLDAASLRITPLALEFMTPPVNDEVGPLFVTWTNLGVIDFANCGAQTVGELIEFICRWGGLAVPAGEPT